MVLIEGELVVSELIIHFVITSVVEATKHHAEEHTHVWVIVQWHASSLLDKEKDQPVVLTALNCNTGEILLKVIWILGSLDPEL